MVKNKLSEFTRAWLENRALNFVGYNYSKREPLKMGELDLRPISIKHQYKRIRCCIYSVETVFNVVGKFQLGL